MRRTLLALLLVLGLGGVACQSSVPQALLPLQHALLAVLLPQFTVSPLRVESGAGGERIAAELVSAEHLVLDGRAWPPGLGFSAHTPALLPWRPLLLFAVVLPWLQRRTWWLTLPGLFGWPLLQVPLVLAGQVWGLVLFAPEPSAAWLLMQVSNALLHGADLAVAALLALPVIALSDHAPAWFGRTTRDPAGGGSQAADAARR